MPGYTWTSSGLIHYPMIDRVDLSPDGQRVAYAVRFPYMTENASEFRYAVWLAAADGQSPPVQLTHDESAAQPAWSPDGRRIAFLRKTPANGRTGVWVMPADGGEAWPITGSEDLGDVTQFKWSPSGEQIAFLAAPWGAEKTQRLARRDDVVHWRVDFDFAQLHVVDVSGPGEPLNPARALTAGRRHVVGLGWSPDGARLAYTHRASPLFDTWSSMRLGVVSVAPGAGPLDLGPVSNRDGAPAYSPDGRWIACEVGVEDNHWPFGGYVHLFPAEGGPSRRLAPTSDLHPALIGWDAEGRGVYVADQTGLSTQIVFLPADGSDATVSVAADTLITARGLNAANRLALVMEDFHQPQAVFVADLLGADGQAQAHKVVQPTAAAYPDGPLPRTKLLHRDSPDGFNIEGILYLPAGYDEAGGEKLPLLLHVHGGPSAVFQRQFAATPYYYTPAALCERGIALLRINPRGSGGYGKDFRFSNLEDWGGGDYRDLQQGVDTVIELGIADPEQLGVCGWSYGGYMTSWTITQTQRFKAASIGAAVTNPLHFSGSADLPSFIPDFFNGEFWERPDFYRQHSPLSYVQNVQTPSIIQHGAADERVPLEQGLILFNALSRRGVPVDMYIYPRQGHAINEPRLLADAIQRNLDWFSAMLGTPADA